MEKGWAFAWQGFWLAIGDLISKFLKMLLWQQRSTRTFTVWLRVSCGSHFVCGFTSGGSHFVIASVLCQNPKGACNLRKVEGHSDTGWGEQVWTCPLLHNSFVSSLNICTDVKTNKTHLITWEVIIPAMFVQVQGKREKSEMTKRFPLKLLASPL